MLDVRQPAEVERSSIEDQRCRNIPLPELRISDINVDRNTEIIFVCQTGIRSYEACFILKGLGYGHTKYLSGGMRAWDFLP